MAKYIGTYATSGDVRTALNESELSRPFIAYTTDDDKVTFGPNVNRAEVGDIVVYSTGDTLLHYVKQADYSASTYPTAAYIPVGVVAMPQADDAILGPTGEITFMGLNYLDTNNPDTGKTVFNTMRWGYIYFDIPELTNYANSGTAITDMNGKVNTQAVLQYATAQTDWRTASAITAGDAAGNYPAFECAWRYHTSGTVQGDWYVPSCGQLNIIKEDSTKLNALNAGFTAIGSVTFNIQYTHGTSTESSNTNKYWCTSSNGFGMEFKNAPYGFRPYSSKLMTRI